MDEEEKPVQEYMSFNGLNRNAMVWGVPFMPLLFIGSTVVLATVISAIKFGPPAGFFLLILIPIFAFLKLISITDDHAIDILVQEIYWVILKLVSGNAKFFGGTLTFSPIKYGRRSENVKRYFAKATGKRRLHPEV